MFTLLCRNGVKKPLTDDGGLDGLVSLQAEIQFATLFVKKFTYTTSFMRTCNYLTQ